jgi:hypothetical protein
MQRSDFDFDVISGPSAPPLIRTAPQPATPAPAEPRDTAPAEAPPRG